MHGNSNIKKRY